MITMQECSRALNTCNCLWSLSCGGMPYMLIVLSITFHFHYYIYMVVCVQLAHFRLGDWRDISIAHITIIIKSEVSNLPIVIIFFVVVCLRCLLHHILSRLHIHSGITGILFSFLLYSLLWLQIVGYVLTCRSYSSVCTLHHLIIIIVQTYLKSWNYKMPVRYILSSVWVRLIIFSQLSIIKYGIMCFQFTHFPCDD